ncbi:MAG: thiamine ABC transporter substrate-binding protein [Anaerolineaceae bacterium]|nr:thiamine ABC transporter substrate-binding protein [Anaerolineaceae bacterium]
MRLRLLLLLTVFALAITVPAYAQDEPETLIVVTHDSFSVTEDLLAQFESEHNIKVEILRSGDAGAMVNQSILTKDNPLGDVLYGVDNTFLSRALDAGLFTPYESSLLSDVPEEFQLDPDYRVTPVDYGDVCLNYDVGYFADNNLPLPESLSDLADPVYKSLLVVENPATSSPGLAFLLSTIAQFGTEADYTYLDYWRDLVANDVYVSDDWSDAYFGQFTAGGGDGTRPLVVSYASSPPFTVDAETGLPTTGSIVADGTCFRQIEFVGILAGTQHEEAARQFIDFMLSVPFQEDMPFQMYVFPVNTQAKLPEEFVQFASIPENPVVFDSAEIDSSREEWIQAWTEVVLR